MVAELTLDYAVCRNENLFVTLQKKKYPANRAQLIRANTSVGIDEPMILLVLYSLQVVHTLETVSCSATVKR